MMKYNDDVIKGFCASISGSSSIDTVLIEGNDQPVTSVEAAKAYQASLWSGAKLKKNKHAMFIGNLCSATNEAIIKANGVTHIVNLCDRCPSSKQPLIRQLNLLVPSEEQGDPTAAASVMLEHLDSITSFIDEGLKTGNVLVYSTRGASRSFFAVAAYLVRNYGWSIDEATAHIMALRPSVEPSDEVVKALVTVAASLPATHAPASS